MDTHLLILGSHIFPPDGASATSTGTVTTQRETASERLQDTSPVGDGQHAAVRVQRVAAAAGRTSNQRGYEENGQPTGDTSRAAAMVASTQKPPGGLPARGGSPPPPHLPATAATAAAFITAATGGDVGAATSDYHGGDPTPRPPSRKGAGGCHGNGHTA